MIKGFPPLPFVFTCHKATNAIAVSVVLSLTWFLQQLLVGDQLSQQLRCLQLAQNAVAMIVTHTQMSKHISPVLKELHWLPVRQWIDHKIMSLVYKCYKGTAPEYLQELIPRYVPAWPLHSSLQPHLQIPSAAEKNTQKKFGFRAFSNSAPKLWNALPQTIREEDPLAAFCRSQKTHLFSEWICTMCPFFAVFVFCFFVVVCFWWFIFPPPTLSAQWALKLMESHAIKVDVINIIMRYTLVNACFLSFVVEDLTWRMIG